MDDFEYQWDALAWLNLTGGEYLTRILSSFIKTYGFVFNSMTFVIDEDMTFSSCIKLDKLLGWVHKEHKSNLRGLQV